MEYVVIFEKGENSYGASVLDLPGCIAVGETMEEVRELIAEAIEFHIEGLREAGDVVPSPLSALPVQSDPSVFSALIAVQV
jgi:predicted RNase H-like HicB family nuclease